MATTKLFALTSTRLSGSEMPLEGMAKRSPGPGGLLQDARNEGCLWSTAARLGRSDFRPEAIIVTVSHVGDAPCYGVLERTKHAKLRSDTAASVLVGTPHSSRRAAQTHVQTLVCAHDSAAPFYLAFQLVGSPGS